MEEEVDDDDCCVVVSIRRTPKFDFFFCLRSASTLKRTRNEFVGFTTTSNDVAHQNSPFLNLSLLARKTQSQQNADLSLRASPISLIIAFRCGNSAVSTAAARKKKHVKSKSQLNLTTHKS